MQGLNILDKKANKFDAIVIGSGMSGGWAAKELCEHGLKTLVLEKGRLVNHVRDYPTMNQDNWDMTHRGALTPEESNRQHIQTRSGFVGESGKHFFTDDIDNPYQEDRRFDWIRGNQTGGRSLIWGRHTYRWSDLDFSANAKDGIAIDWPVRYKEIEPWYSYVEKFVGICGEKLGLAHVPDGEFLKPFELNCLEKEFKKKVSEKLNGRIVTIGRVAHLTEPQPWHLELGRGKCQTRNRCSRGCPFGAYFSSNSATLPAANRTGNLSLRPDSIVHSLIYNDKTNKVTGVNVIDSTDMSTHEYFADIVFLCASAPASAQILLHTTSTRFPNGLGNDSGELGHNIMDHHYHVGAMGDYEGMEDQYYKGKRPTGIYIPKYTNIDQKSNNPQFLRGFGYQGDSGRSGWNRGNDQSMVGADFKEKLFKPGNWRMSLMGFGEVLPDHNNKMYLSKDKTDKWGIPQIVFDASHGENEMKMRPQIKADAAEMLEVSGFKNVKTFDNIGGLGNGVHEMGTARMGNDPKKSVLNKWNQVHAVSNLYVTDGSFMVSSNCVNPSITYMAFTARAVDHAIKEMKNKNL
ncbi:MAG: GMC family oxidoreductase [Saprospiraceae bacterium]